jgi:hypothetical protein
MTISFILVGLAVLFAFEPNLVTNHLYHLAQKIMNSL